MFGEPIDMTPFGALVKGIRAIDWLLTLDMVSPDGHGCPGALRLRGRQHVTGEPSLFDRSTEPASSALVVKSVGFGRGQAVRGHQGVVFCRRRWRTNPLHVLMLCLGMVGGTHADSVRYTPVKWERFVKVDGQPLPVPEQWLQDEEARIAHSLKLPDTVPKPVLFDFDKAWWKAKVPGAPAVNMQYFDHLCGTEAGEWIVKRVENVEGLYFARPQGMPPRGLLTDLYGPEMPWIQRILMLQGDYKPQDQGSWFIQPPNYNYKFVEQPRRDVKWQKSITDPYVRLFGYTREIFIKPGHVVAALNDKTPMQIVGTPQLKANYGYTWRGVRRDRDREHGIAGGEVLIFDLQTHEVLAVRRQFLITGKNPRGTEKAVWEVAARCSQLHAYHDSGEFTQFSFDVLHTIEPSTTGRK